MTALRVQKNEWLQRSKSSSSDLSVDDISGSLCSTSDNSVGVCDSAPRLIPTPSIPLYNDAEDYPEGAGSSISSLFTSQEMTHIMKAEKLVRQLKHRFDCQPERMNIVRDCFNQWLRHEISTDQLDQAVSSELTGDHPDDPLILESFRWFIEGSHEYYGTSSQAQSPRSSGDSGSLLLH